MRVRRLAVSRAIKATRWKAARSAILPSLHFQLSTLLIPITERFLSECGGWQALREARSIRDAGRVIESAYEPPLLRGRVQTADSEVCAGLRILSESNVENLCTCRESRREGRICAHSLAVGLAFLQRARAPAPPAPAIVAELNGPRISAEGDRAIELHVVLPPDFSAAWDKAALTVGIEVASEGRRVLLSALDPTGNFRVDPGDLALIKKLRALCDGVLPGVASFPRAAFLELLGALAGHGRVTFGRDIAVKVSEQGTTLDASPPSSARILTAGPHAWLLDGPTFTRILAVRSASDGAAPPLASVAVPDGFVLNLEGSLRHLTAELAVRYGERTWAIGAARPNLNAPAEEAALDRLRAAGFAGPDAHSQLVLRGESPILLFFARLLPKLQGEWKVKIGARFEHVTREIDRIQPRLEIRSSGEDWFDLQFELGTATGERFSAAEIQRLLHSGQSSVRLKNRRLAVFDPAMLDEFQQVLRDCEPRQIQPGLYRIDRKNAAYLAETAREEGAEFRGEGDWQSLVGGATAQPVSLGTLEEILRPYQKHGVYWLKSLADKRMSGILADEMGLGKTVQALAFLSLIGGKSLVVCPASLVFNWQREATRFTPHIPVTALVGSDRHARVIAGRDGSGLFITSYSLLRRDIESYRAMEFAAVILDEAQHIKNPNTQNAQAAYSLRARHRFALTGTPVENSVCDLWSLMHFLMPGYLGSRNDFRDRYELPIQSQAAASVLPRLQRRLRPFMIRRLKRDVINDLPDKIEQISYCELNAYQRKIYERLLLAARVQAEQLAGAANQGKGRMLMLTALLRLRQVCCDPQIVEQAEVQNQTTSSKVELLDELLAEAIDGCHSVLVFSQFVSMLHILRDHLKKSRTECCYLDGQTKDRSLEVDRFQAGGVPVFLISLKAGGTGLNLTAADTVVHFEPWWNPAVEAQATDRTHRIGQKRVVTNYKLIARGTVEEKILALQQRKRKIFDAALERQSPIMEDITTDEIREILD